MKKISKYKHFLLICPILISLVGCSIFGKQEELVKRKSFEIKNHPKNWQEQKTDKAQNYFLNDQGSVFYANSYCGHYDKSLKELALGHIEQLGETNIVEQRVLKFESQPGLFSKIVSSYKGDRVELYHYGVKVKDCYYDLNAIASQGDEIEGDFKQFIQAMKL